MLRQQPGEVMLSERMSQLLDRERLRGLHGEGFGMCGNEPVEKHRQWLIVANFH